LHDEDNTSASCRDLTFVSLTVLYIGIYCEPSPNPHQGPSSSTHFSKVSLDRVVKKRTFGERTSGDTPIGTDDVLHISDMM